MIGLPDINTIFDAQGLSNCLPDNSHLQSQSKSSLQSSQLSSLSSNHKSLVMPSLSSMTLRTNLRSHPQSANKQCIPGHVLPPYEDIQCTQYKSPVTTIQQPIISHQQDDFDIPTSSTSN